VLGTLPLSAQCLIRKMRLLIIPTSQRHVPGIRQLCRVSGKVPNTYSYSENDVFMQNGGNAKAEASCSDHKEDILWNGPVSLSTNTWAF
jgi:hypothetical protein